MPNACSAVVVIPVDDPLPRDQRHITALDDTHIEDSLPVEPSRPSPLTSTAMASAPTTVTLVAAVVAAFDTATELANDGPSCDSTDVKLEARVVATVATTASP